MDDRTGRGTRIALIILLLLLLVPSNTMRAGEPPAGPPWQMDYWSAKSEALRTGTPIFIYFTKTY
ncbi:hypothetical protein ACFL3H_08550 [Gemmatimonadota bacterium]